MYSFVFSKTFKKQLGKLPKNARSRIINALERMKIRPYSFVLRMVGSPFYRLRVGDYRVIMEIKDRVLEIHVVRVGHRKKVYK